VSSKSLIFVTPGLLAFFGNLFSVGDAESIYRIMKILEQKGRLEILERDDVIYLVSPSHASVSDVAECPEESLTDVHLFQTCTV